MVFAAAPFAINADVLAVVNFTYPFEIQPYTLMYRRPRELSRTLLFVNPFTSLVTPYLMSKNPHRYFIRGNISILLSSCFTCLASNEQVDLFLIKHNQSSWKQSSKTGVQPYSDASLHEVSGYSLHMLFNVNLWLPTQWRERSYDHKIKPLGSYLRNKIPITCTYWHWPLLSLVLDGNTTSRNHEIHGKQIFNIDQPIISLTQSNQRFPKWSI